MVLYKRKLNIPIFDAVLTVNVVDNLEDYNLDETVNISNDTSDAFVFYSLRNYSMYFLKYEVGAVVHEVKHIVNYIFKDFHIQLDVDNDEMECIMMSYITRFVTKTLQDYERKRDKTNN